MKNDSLVIGADIGGTHITAALVDMEKKIILLDTLVREKVDAGAPAEQVIEVWSNAIARAARGRSEILSLAMPGPFDYENGVSYMQGQGKYEPLYGRNVRELLASRLGLAPGNISMMNDAAAFLQGEVCVGAGYGLRKAVGVTLGTGLGSGIYQEGVAEEAGLWQAPYRGDIAENYLCTRWFVRRYRELTGDTVTGVLELLSKMEHPAAVRQVFEEFGENLGRVLVPFISLHEPQVVVIGGNIAKSYERFREPLLGILRPQHPGVPVRTALLGEKAALLGAASYRDSRHPLKTNHPTGIYID
ncbi:ROK family protein [Paraflavisolibacter sp. H34]|uniref:ROK family protein n=1 Tax=Huijunlia imazamoxiresistens TaxID=3127457 RepID=UPI0030171681